jgi:hypothetical protein
MMSRPCSTYPDEAAARDAAEVLQARGDSAHDVRVLARRRVHDIRREPAGEFGRTVGPDARVGSFGNVPKRRWQGAGTYWGDADAQRQGSFADAEYDDAVVLQERG